MLKYIQFKASSDQTTLNPDTTETFINYLPNGIEMITNSLEFSGVLNVTKGGNPLGDNDRIYFDSSAGMWNFFDVIITSFDDVVIEGKFTEYSRYEKMMTSTESSVSELSSFSKHLRQLKCANDTQTTQIMRGSEGFVPFSGNPRICVNRTSRNISSSDVKKLSIMIRLKSVSKALYGEDLDGTVSYNITNFKMTYLSQPAQKYSDKLSLSLTTQDRKQVSSQMGYVEFELPVSVYSTATSFSNSTVYVSNTMQFIKPTINELTYLINDSNNPMISYNFRDDEEILLNYIYALGEGVRSEITAIGVLNFYTSENNVSPIQFYGVGMDFMGQLSPKTKITMQINTNDADAGTPLELFTYFHSNLQL